MIPQFINSGIMDKALSYPGFYDPALILLSLFAAYLGAFSGLSAIHNIRTNFGKTRALWLLFGALALGNGVFAMHFIGMLAFKLPIPYQFDLGLTVFSGLPAILSAAWLLHLVSRQKESERILWISGAIAGVGIGLMHYTGMMAMHLDAKMLFDPVLFFVSIIVAVVLAILSIYARHFASMLGLDPDMGLGRQVSPIIMGTAISGMHYTAMSATWFFPSPSIHDQKDILLEPVIIGMGLAFLFFIMIASTLFSLYLGFGQRNTDKKLQTIAIVLQKKNRHLFFKSLAIILTVFSMIAWIYTYVHNSTEEITQKYTGELELDRTIKAAVYNFESIIYDLNMLTGGGHLSEFIDKGGAFREKQLTQQFLFISNERRIYDQIRFIDNHGMEIVRINSSRDGHAVQVPDSKLQNKANRDYFKKAIELPQGEFHLSRFDLNMEQGKVEEPHKPMIRFSAPVFDSSGNKRGVIVLNYLGNIVLDLVRDVFEDSNNSIYLIDKEGYFLLSPNIEETWGFMFNRPSTFESKFPVMWNYIQGQGKGAFQTKQGHFIFDSLMVSMREDLKSKLERSGETWKVVIHIDKASWSFDDLKDHPIVAIILICSLLLSGFIAWIATLFIVTRQLSEQAEAEALRELEFQKKALDEHAIVSTTNVQGNITYVNDKFVAISGYNREDLIGENHRMVKSDEHSPEFYKELWRTIATGNSWHGEVRNLTKSGDSYWVRASIVPFLNAKGKPFKYVSIRTDVTAMKALEKNLLNAKEAAEVAGQAKSDFLANMRHEIRTPMNAIIGMSHLCLQTRLTARQKDYVSKTHNSATSLLRILNDILDFSKIDAGHLDMESIDFTLEEVLGSMAAMITLKAQEKKLEFLMETAVDIPPTLIGDPLRLGQILINLANNAIKFTEEGEVAVVTKMLEKGEDYVRLQFTMRDTGIGMTDEQSAGLFQAFSQADSSITRKYGGTGLGLTISQRLIEMMDGTIQVESDPGVGSRFIFDVRLGVSNRVIEKTLTPTTDLRGMKVLAVDDNESARNVISEYLTSFSFKVSIAMNGKEAMIAVQEADLAEDPFELVVMDYMMPDVDGITASGKIKKELGLKKPPVIIMATAYGEESVVKRAANEAQIDGFLVKPINQSLLFEAIMETFGKTEADENRTGMAFDGRRDFNTVLSGAKILLVEDNEINQQVARELLEQANITVTVAENGKQALDMASKETYDGVLMDMQMPVMDGLTATREIRKSIESSKLPIIAMTANAMSGDRDRCLEAGMQDHIAKPIDPTNMFSTLAKWVKPASPKLLPKVSEQKDGELESELLNEKPHLPDISGINVQSGLRRMGGNIKSYLGLLAKFRINQGKADIAILEALTSQDMETAERLAHTLKGVAATIGAEELQEKANELESAIKNCVEKTQIEAKLIVVATVLERVCSAIDTALPEQKKEAVTPVHNSEETEHTIQDRNTLLKEAFQKLSIFDSAIENTLISLKKLHLPLEISEGIEEMMLKVEQYDFDGATAILKQCTQSLGIDLENDHE